MKKVLLLLSSIAISLGVFAGNVATVTYDAITLVKNSTWNYQLEDETANYTLDNPLAAGDVITVNVKGKVSAAVEGLQVFLVECTAENGWKWTVLSDYVALSEAIAEGGTIDATVNVEATKASDGNVVRVYVSTTNAPVEGVDYVTIAEGAAPVPPYTDPVLGLLTNIWGEGNAISGKTMTFAAKDTGIGFADYGSGFDLSQYTYITFTLTEFPSFAEYGQIVVNDVEDNKATFAFEENVAIIDLSEVEGNVKQLYFQCGGVGDVTIESITFSTEPLAISSVNPDFAVVDGMVYSAGEITVYNVAGKLIATASQAFDVNSLQAGVYFIVAQEGTIKFVK